MLRHATALAALLLTACGGSSSGGDSPSTGSPGAAEREAAARATALNHPACVTAQPFYWTIGDTSGPLAGASVGTGAPGAGTNMSIASASKWLYASHVAELRQGALSAEDVKFLTFSSGYTGFDDCLQGQTVAECQSYQGTLIHNGDYVAAHDGKFYYSGGHMQKHATLPSMGLGPDDNAALAQHIAAGLNGTMSLAYTQPQLAGGAYTNATEYGRFLQRVLSGQLRMGSLLDANKVCTNPTTCATAVVTPIPLTESWHYSIGHWVEDDPAVGDGAFSSPGAFGFYPWIDANRRYWGVLARYSVTGTGNADPMQRPYVQSVMCGRQIRAAWLSGVARQ